jgi:ribose transport system permease protein
MRRIFAIKARYVLSQYSQVVIFGILLTVASLANPAFLNTSNIINIIRQASLLGILSIGMTIVIITGGIDLSNGSVLALLSCLGGTWINSGGSIWIVIPLIVLGAGLVGSMNGILIVKVGLPPFIATFGMMQICRGLAFTYMKGEVIYGFNPDFRFLGAGKWLGIPFPIFLLIICLIVFYFVMNRTSFGWRIYAAGANPIAAHYMGINVKTTLLSVYAINSMISAFVGFIYVSRLNAAEASVGELFPLEAIAASVIGGASLFGGKGTVSGAILGAIIITIILNLMNLFGVSSVWQEFAIGLIIVGSVLLQERGIAVFQRFVTSN